MSVPSVEKVISLVLFLLDLFESRTIDETLVSTISILADFLKSCLWLNVDAEMSFLNYILTESHCSLAFYEAEAVSSESTW